MKKNYLTPASTMQECETTEPLAASGVTSYQDDIEIGYGGVDEEGGKEADSRHQDYIIWEGEEEEEENW